MPHIREERRIGLDALESVTGLLNRIRTAHQTAGLYEAADLQWWWGQRARASDGHAQSFWFDDDRRPVAAVIVTTEMGDKTQLDPMFMLDVEPDLVTRAMEHGLANAADHGIRSVSLEVDPADTVLREFLNGRGFTMDEEGIVEAWLDAQARPAVTALAEGYQLRSRAETSDRPHHMISEARKRPDPEARLRQTSLYRDDLDLVVFDADDNVAAYGLFWFNPITRTGLVEPMRTEDAHQRRGLARHVLTAGLDRLAHAGAERIKICFEPDNPASSHLYLDVGFQPHRQTVMYEGPTRH